MSFTTTGQSEKQNDDKGQSPAPYTMARYTIHVPGQLDGQDASHILDRVHELLRQFGIDGNTTIKAAEGHWQDYDPEPMHLVMVDAPSSNRVGEIIKTLARWIKEGMNQEAVYVTKQPIETWLI